MPDYLTPSDAEERAMQKFIEILDAPTKNVIQDMKTKHPFAYYKLAGILSQFGHSAALWAVQMLRDMQRGQRGKS